MIGVAHTQTSIQETEVETGTGNKKLGGGFEF